MGAVGAIAKPGVDFLIVLARTVQAGAFWWPCNLTGGALLGRYLVDGFARRWGFVIITCTVISWVIYGLRTEVHEARRLGQYVLERKIDEGGMGEVYRARHGMMRRPSALKLLRGGHAGEVNLRRGAHPANIMLCTQASARIWWLEHRLALDDKGADSAPDTGAMRTIAVDAAPRSPANEGREPSTS